MSGEEEDESELIITVNGNLRGKRYCERFVFGVGGKREEKKREEKNFVTKKLIKITTIKWNDRNE
jgi:hypothetical protein